MTFLVIVLLGFLAFYLFKIVLSWIYKALPERYRLYLDDLRSIDITVNKYGERIDRPWIVQHLTDEQWRQHRRSFKEYTRQVGKYENFRGGTIGWLKCEGLPPITPEMEAYLEEWRGEYEKKLLDAGMTDELAQWRERNRERQAAIEAIKA
jgi:hypothetical protein